MLERGDDVKVNVDVLFRNEGDEGLDEMSGIYGFDVRSFFTKRKDEVYTVVEVWDGGDGDVSYSVGYDEMCIFTFFEDELILVKKWGE